MGVDLAGPLTVDRMTLGVVADGLHSVPEQLHLEVDGANVGTIDIPAITDSTTPGHVTEVPVSFAPVTGSRFRLVVDTYRPVDPDASNAVRPDTLPVSLATVGLAGVPAPADPITISGECRDDLLRIDGAPVSVRLTGAVADARRGFGMESCTGPVALDTGSHTVTSAVGLDAGIDVDRVVLSSGAAGTATTVAPRARRSSPPVPRSRCSTPARRRCACRCAPTGRRTGWCSDRASTMGGRPPRRLARSGATRSSTATPTGGRCDRGRAAR